MEKRCESARAIEVQVGMDRYLAACANHWMPQEIPMGGDLALWKDPQGLSKTSAEL